jgi:nucleotide-binding universal stress UspA family protein
MGMRIVVGVDGSQAAGRALVWAAETASRDHRQLVIAHSGEVPAKTDVASGDAPDDSRDLLRDAVATAIDVGRHCDVTTVLRDVAPAQLLLDLSNEAQALVVGTRGRGRIVGVLLGSVAYRVAAHARCPVVVVPEDWRAPGDASHLVAVGVSSSSSGREALEYALAEAERRGSALVAVRSWPERESGAQPGDAAVKGNGTVRQQQQELLSALVEQARAEHPGVEVVTDLTSAPVYDALFAAAGKADLLVLGCRHDDDHHFSRLGPIASRLLHTAPCPVAIVGHPLAQDLPDPPEPAPDEHAFERA